MKIMIFLLLAGLFFHNSMAFAGGNNWSNIEVGERVVFKTAAVNIMKYSWVNDLSCKVQNNTHGIVTEINLLYPGSNVKGLFKVSFDSEFPECDTYFLKNKSQLDGTSRVEVLQDNGSDTSENNAPIAQGRSE